jgi:alpha-tubulin suppressor-like RCC1 family protein
VDGGPTDVTAVRAGALHSCFLGATGAAHCFGSNLFGQLGSASDMQSTTPIVVPGPTYAALALGRFHSCARGQDGTVSCWGANTNGQLGDNSTVAMRPPPMPVPGLTGIVELATGGDHNCARDGAGTIRCWGANLSGQLGDGTATNRSAPVEIHIQ